MWRDEYRNDQTSILDSCHAQKLRMTPTLSDRRRNGVSLYDTGENADQRPTIAHVRHDRRSESRSSDDSSRCMQGSPGSRSFRSSGFQFASKLIVDIISVLHGIQCARHPLGENGRRIILSISRNILLHHRCRHAIRAKPIRFQDSQSCISYGERCPGGAIVLLNQ